METGRNIHCKRSRELQWGNEASQELLKLRYKTLRPLFDQAETVADVHEAWGVVASRLNAMESLGMEEVDPVDCSDQLTKLKVQWQDSNTQLQVMMAECFGKERRANFNRAMEASPKRRKQTEPSIEAQAAELEAPEPSAEEQVEVSNGQVGEQESARGEARGDGGKIPRQDEIMRALEQRAQQLERLAQSHNNLADITKKLMEALVNQQNL
ncbi:hypothetical protein DVH05_024042 [Phytophthora capsici]|nr:hypothetical protein DVH05_024042 [Phytophthora capsici]